jgi:hypothetical protein
MLHVLIVNHRPINDSAIAQAVNPRILTAETRVKSKASLYGICDGKTGTRTGFSLSISAFFSQCYFISAPYSFSCQRYIILPIDNVDK